VRTISTGVNVPNSLGTDASNNLYVANGGTSDVTVYAPATSFLRTIKSGVIYPRPRLDLPRKRKSSGSDVQYRSSVTQRPNGRFSRRICLGTNRAHVDSHITLSVPNGIYVLADLVVRYPARSVNCRMVSTYLDRMTLFVPRHFVWRQLRYLPRHYELMTAGIKPVVRVLGPDCMNPPWRRLKHQASGR
jgi:hypothetical protein